MPYGLLSYLLLINAAGLVIMLADKQAARKRKRRVPESALLTLAVLGGSPGCWAGMYLFRHKTRKRKFSMGIPLILCCQLLLAGLLAYALG